MKVVIYTDGACSGNGKENAIGGIGVLIKAITKNTEYNFKLSQAFEKTTNNRMELQAAITALDFILGNNHFIFNQKTYFQESVTEIFVDSEYVKNGITSWILNWKKKKWKTAQNKDVLNKELWQKLDKLNEKLKPNWNWVKGHSDDKSNEICDKLAVNAIKTFKENGKYKKLVVETEEISLSNNKENDIDIDFFENTVEDNCSKDISENEWGDLLNFEDSFKTEEHKKKMDLNNKVFQIYNSHKKLLKLINQKELIVNFELHDEKYLIKIKQENGEFSYDLFMCSDISNEGIENKEEKIYLHIDI